MQFVEEYSKQNPHLVKRSEINQKLEEIIYVQELSKNKTTQHINAHINHALNTGRQHRAIQNIVKSKKLTINTELQTEYDRYIFCAHLLHNNKLYHHLLFNHTKFFEKHQFAYNLTIENNQFILGDDTKSKIKKNCKKLIDDIDHYVTPDHGTLVVEKDYELTFNHERINQTQFEEIHNARGDEYLYDHIKNKTMQALKKRSGKYVLAKRHIENMYSNFEFQHEGDLHSHEKRSLATVTASIGAFFDYVFTTLFKVVAFAFNCILRLTPFDFRIIPPANITDAFNKVVDYFNTLFDNLTGPLVADPGAFISTQYHKLIDQFICQIPEDFDGTNGYNLKCLFSLLLPEDILFFVEPPPNSLIPKQINWPTCIENRIKTTRIVDEGVEGSVIVYNNRTGLCDYGGTQILFPNGTIDEIGTCKLVDLMDDDDDELKAHFLVPYKLTQRKIKVFTIVRFAEGLLTGNLTKLYDYDPNNNCKPYTTAPYTGSNTTFPFCPAFDYSVGEYQSCQNDFGWNNVYNSWLYFLYIIPRQINIAFHSFNPLHLLAFVFPVPFTIYFPDIFVFGFIYNIYDTIVTALLLQPLGNEILLALRITQVAYWLRFILNLPLIETYYRHFLFLLFIWVISLCVEFPLVVEDGLINGLCNTSTTLSTNSIIVAIKLSPLFSGISTRCFDYKVTPCPDNFCYYWTFAYWILGWLATAGIFLGLRLLWIVIWTAIVVFFETIYPIIVSIRNRLQLVRTYNRSIRNQTLTRQAFIIAAQDRQRINRLEEKLDAALVSQNLPISSQLTTTENETSATSSTSSTSYSNNNNNDDDNNESEIVIPNDEELDAINTEHNRMIYKRHAHFRNHQLETSVEKLTRWFSNLWRQSLESSKKQKTN